MFTTFLATRPDRPGAILTALGLRLRCLARFFSLHPRTLWYLREMRRTKLFDRAHYRTANPSLNRLFRAFPERHYIAFGEALGLSPNPGFSPRAYLAHNRDVAEGGARPFLHYLRYGRHERRLTREPPAGAVTGQEAPPTLRPDPAGTARAQPQAVVVHVYYHELWPEIAGRLRRLDLPFDLFVTIARRDGPEGEAETRRLATRIAAEFPGARAIPMPNRGRDVAPFVHLVNSGLLAPYRAVCKIHTKRSPHRDDGDDWRRQLIGGILPGPGTAALLERFLADPGAAIWVADGQHYRGGRWWGSNLDITAWLLRRAELRIDAGELQFPAGSMYWLKPGMLAMIAALRLEHGLFETECGQVDGTLAHAFERALGFLAVAAHQAVRETSALPPPRIGPPRPGPGFVSAFYLPQFHRTAENDAWWGRGYTEWQAAARAKPQFDGHAQPCLPGELGFYDLRQTEVMGEQAALARAAGIDAFCVYHYWFGGRRLLRAPMEGLLARPEVDFPFYLCWANESWRRNWDGLSGEVLVEQDYAPGFEAALAADTAPYMRDPRYARPDGARPRFVLYRPGDLPEPAANVARLRAAWAGLGLGEVELGAVLFHQPGRSAVPEDLFDFWVEMPPHGLVEPPDYLFGGPGGNRLGPMPAPGFRGLIYDMNAVIAHSLSPSRAALLPANTIAGAMPSWDNTARRGSAAHIAYGAHPGAFRHWLDGLSVHRLGQSYRRELMLNAWNEWAERAVLEPSQHLGRAWLDALADWRFGADRRRG